MAVNNRQASQRRRPARAAKKTHFFKPQLEFLEDRTVPAPLNLLVNLPGDAGTNSGATSGDIRFCITQANANPGSTITFNPAAAGATIVLANGELPITASMTISGPGATVEAISGSNMIVASRVFDITNAAAIVSISGLTIENGVGTITSGMVFGIQGGDIANVGSLTLSGDVVKNGAVRGAAGGNTGSGGGIPGGSARGGGIFNGATGVLVIDSTTVSSNTAQGGNGGNALAAATTKNGGAGGSAQGGGVFNAAGGQLTLQNNSTFSLNFAIGGFGGSGNTPTTAGANGGNGGTGGSASGGAVFNAGALVISATSFTSNQAQGGGGGAGGAGLTGGVGATGGGGGVGASGGSAFGGAVDNTMGALVITGGSFASNKAQSGSGGSGGTGATGGANGAGVGGNGGTGGGGGGAGTAHGGGLFNSGGDVTVTSAPFTANIAQDGLGGNGGMGGGGGTGTTTNGNGGSGGGGGNGNSASGGGIAVTTSNLTISGSAFSQNKVIGQAGGSGGAGGAAGTGGPGTGGTGGTGGSGGDGGSVWGGGVAARKNVGNVSVTNSPFTSNSVMSGAGGTGGVGGNGDAATGTGGDGGSGGRGETSWGGGLDVDHSQGAAHGGTLTVTLTNSPFTTNTVTSGVGGAGGNGGSGNIGGAGGQGNENFEAWGGGFSVFDSQGPTTLTVNGSAIAGNVAHTLNGGAGGSGGFGTTTGGAGGQAGEGDSSWGGGISLGGGVTYSLNSSPITNNQALGGNGGLGGAGGNAGAGGTGGNGSSGAAGGEAWGGGLSVFFNNGTSGASSLTNSPVTGNQAISGNGGAGGNGGSPTSGGTGGNGGSGGSGLSAWGGGIEISGNSTGSLTVTNSAVSNNIVRSGDSGNGGNGGTGGAGGAGGSGGISNSVWGGGIIASRVSFSLISSPVNSNQAVDGRSGNGGNGGTGTAGAGGTGGSGGSENSAWGGGLMFRASSNATTLQISNSDITNNSLTELGAGNGGAGGNGTTTGGAGGAGGSVNQASGGGISYQAQGNTQITDSAIAGNTIVGGPGGAGGTGGTGGTGAGGAGGAGGNAALTQGAGLFFNRQGSSPTLTITDSTFGGPGDANVATGGNGGAGGNAGTGTGNANGGKGGNSSTVQGGGIFITGSNVAATLTSDTIAANQVVAGTAGTGGTASGAGTAGAAGTAGTVSGGGYFSAGGAGTVNNIVNTIIDLNVGPTDPDVHGAFTSQGHNIIGTVGTATGFIASDMTGVTAAQLNLGPLQNNGGNTLTDALLPGSVAINAGDNTMLAGQTTDQRGFPRIINGTVDIGAFEFQGAVVTVTVTPASPTVAVNGTDTITITVTNTSSNALPLDNSTVTVTLPAGLSVAGGTALTFPLGALAPGATATFTLTVTGTATGAQTVTVTVTSPDTTPNNTTGTATITVGTPPPPPTAIVNYYVVGADAGGGPQVVVYNAATGKVVSSFFAFTPTFAGGVRLAVADINGDGTQDIIAAAGPGGGPQVIVVDGTKLTQLQANGQIANSALLASFYAFTPTFTGGVFVAAKSLGGVSRIVAGADAGGGPQVIVVDGAKIKQVQSNGQIAPAAVLSSFYAFQPFFTGGVRVAIGDVNGDGTLDVIAGAGVGGGPQVIVVDGTKLKQLQANGQIANAALLSSFYAFASTFQGGIFVSAGDVNGDGKAEVIVGAGAGGAPQVNIFNGNTGAVLQAFLDPRLGPAPKVISLTTGGVRVANTTYLGHPAILTATGANSPPLVDIIDDQTLGLLSSFFALPQTFLGGDFVGG